MRDYVRFPIRIVPETSKEKDNGMERTINSNLFSEINRLTAQIYFVMLPSCFNFSLQNISTCARKGFHLSTTYIFTRPASKPMCTLTLQRKGFLE
jgi:hypothetical protein